MLFVYSRKKNYEKNVEKKKKFYLPIYPIFWSMEPPLLSQEVFSYCWISISKKYVKQVVLINHSWISPILQQGWELELCLFFKKWGRVHFSPKKGEVGKIVEEWRLLRENNLCLLANLCVYKSKKHYNPRYIYKSNKFYYIPKFLRYPIFFTKYLSEIAGLYFRNRHLYKNLSCGAHFQFNNHDLFWKCSLELDLLIKKQFPARLSHPSVKLSSFIGVKFFPKKRESNLCLLLIFMFVNPRNFIIQDTRVASFNISLIFEN